MSILLALGEPLLDRIEAEFAVNEGREGATSHVECRLRHPQNMWKLVSQAQREPCAVRLKGGGTACDQ
eukprot:3327510-Prymnesium_polylepis.1